MTSADLLQKIHDKPFRPFRMKLVNNATFDVVDPGMIIVGDSSAVVATQNIYDQAGHPTTTDWRTISIDHILEFAGINGKATARAKRRGR